MGVRGKLGDVPGEKLAAFTRKPPRRRSGGLVTAANFLRFGKEPRCAGW
jgi:hypothetical protein